MNDPSDVPKVLVYVLRRRGAGGGGGGGQLQLLVHEHRDVPEAGVQVPAGTVEPGENPADAAARELFEESGLRLPAGRSLELIREYRWFNPHAGTWHRRHVFVADLDEPRDRWEHVVTGAGEDRDMLFCYRWLDLADAEHGLCGDQGGSIGFIRAREGTPT